MIIPDKRKPDDLPTPLRIKISPEQLRRVRNELSQVRYSRIVSMDIKYNTIHWAHGVIATNDNQR